MTSFRFLYFAFALILFFILLSTKQVMAGRCGPPINPIMDVNWQCMFPIRTGGMVEFNNGQSDPSTQTENPTCLCMKAGIPYLGISASYWEPFAIMDTVSDPWCFMPLGTKSPAGIPGKLRGNQNRKTVKSSVFAQAHYYKFPALNLLELYQDLPCNSGEKEFDLALMTEVIPTWNDEIMALMLNPEAVLFGNPATLMACVAEVTTLLAAGKNIDYLYWCMGSWGSAYPLAGSATNTDYVEANASIAAKAIYLLGRTNLLKDRAVSQCGSVYTPIWNKSHYKMHAMKPVKDGTCRPIGTSGLLWTHNKNPVFMGDNFSWMLFRKNRCCVGF